jgi:AcrR family transcriptional regulator
MTKAQETREKIIALAAPIFNQYGYSGTSISDIMRATGLEKGGIYNHFSGKDELALASFDYNYRQVRRHFARVVREAGDSPSAQLLAMTAAYNHTILPSGCPLLNTAIESDDTHPALKARVQAAIEEWRQLIIRIVNDGINCGEFYQVDGNELATWVIASIEGGTMLAKLYDDMGHIERVVVYLTDYIRKSVIK